MQNWKLGSFWNTLLGEGIIFRRLRNASEQSVNVPILKDSSTKLKFVRLWVVREQLHCTDYYRKNKRRCPKQHISYISKHATHSPFWTPRLSRDIRFAPASTPPPMPRNFHELFSRPDRIWWIYRIILKCGVIRQRWKWDWPLKWSGCLSSEETVRGVIRPSLFHKYRLIGTSSTRWSF